MLIPWDERQERFCDHSWKATLILWGLVSKDHYGSSNLIAQALVCFPALIASINQPQLWHFLDRRFSFQHRFLDSERRAGLAGSATDQLGLLARPRHLCRAGAEHRSLVDRRCHLGSPQSALPADSDPDHLHAHGAAVRYFYNAPHYYRMADHPDGTHQRHLQFGRLSGLADLHWRSGAA